MNTPIRDIPVNVEVDCCDETCGRSTYIVLNPVTDEVTHIVVKEKHYPFNERLVPVDMVAESSPRVIHLRCDAPKLDQFDPFIEKEFILAEEPRYVAGPFAMWPFNYTTEEYIPLEHERIPVGELAIRRGARVEATDGQVGRVDEFVVNPESTHITHLVMREGHLWGQKDVTIPVSLIDHIDEDTVFLKTDKDSIAELPTVPVHRR